MTRKNWTLLFIVLGVLALAALLFFFVFRDANDIEVVDPGAVFPEGDVVRDDIYESPDAEVFEGEFFRKISRRPVSGYTVFERSVGTTTTETVIRFVDRATGHVYETVAGNTREINRLTNTTIPRVEEALFVNPDTVILRYLSEDESIETFVGTLTEVEGNDLKKLDGVYIDSGIESIAVSPEGDSFAYISDGALVIADTTGSERSRMPLDLSEWNISWGDADTLLLTTRTSFGMPGYAFLFNTESKSMVPVLRKIQGLSGLLSPDGGRVFFTSSGNEGVTTSLLNTETGVVADFEVSTVGEKCVWSGNAEQIFCAVPEALPRNLPDSWYKGRASLPGDIYALYPESGASEFVFSGDSTGERIDATTLELSDNGQAVFFINKIDMSLWMVDIL